METLRKASSTTIYSMERTVRMETKETQAEVMTLNRTLIIRIAAVGFRDNCIVRIIIP